MVEAFLDQSLRKIDVLFKLTGTNIAIGEAVPTKTKKNRFIYVLNFILLNVDVLGSIGWFVLGVYQGRSFTELTYVAPCLTLCFLGNVKSLFLIIYEKNMYKLMENLRTMEEKERNRETNTERAKIIDKEVTFLNFVVSVLYVLNVIVLVCFALQTLVLMAITYMKTNEVEFLLPFRILYPFDVNNFKVWPIIYIRQIWSEVVPVFYTCVADFLFYNFCAYIRIQFRLLQHDIKNVITGSQNSIPNGEMFGGEIQNKLIEIIKRHQELITCVNLLESIYSIPTLYNFISSSLIICLTGFNVTENILVVTFVAFLFMGLLQIFFLCFFGNILMEASIEVSDAVYNSKWYLVSPKIRKTFLLIQTRAQSPSKLTAFGFADVSLRAFMKILSTSWSYFALLKTLYRSE